MRTLVSFSWNASRDVSAEILAGEVATALRAAGLVMDGPRNHDDHAWSMWVHEPEVSIELLVGHRGDDEHEWLIICTPMAKGLWRAIRERRAQRLERAGRALQALDACLRASGAVTTIRWYERADFEANRVDRWADGPGSP